MIEIGDVVYVELAPGERAKATRVLGLTTTRRRGTNQIVGWLVTLERRRSIWLRRHERLARRSA